MYLNKYNGIKRESWNTRSQHKDKVKWNLLVPSISYGLKNWGGILRRTFNEQEKYKDKQ